MDRTRALMRQGHLNAAVTPQSLDVLRSVGPHMLKGNLSACWAVTIDGPLRLVFRFEAGTPATSRSSTTIEANKMKFGRFHPGATLREQLDARNLSASALALKMRIAPQRLHEILRGKRAIGPETVLRLGHYFGNEAEFWLNLQTQCDLAELRRRDGARIASEVEAA